MVAKHRTERNLTQQEVAERMGIGSEAISRLERGLLGLSDAELMQLADIFDCRMDELLKESSSRPNDQS